MIKTYNCRETAKLAEDKSSKRFGNIERVARRKLEMLQAAIRIEDLKNPPGNRLEALKGDREGQYSIRINDQFRLCFEWKDGFAWNVEIVDYH